MLDTERLLLRPWRPEEAAIQRELWAERDDRIPAHRRLSPDRRPTVSELTESIRSAPPPSATGLLAIQRKVEGDVIGYAGLVAGDAAVDGEPMLAYELLRRHWGRGFATEAGRAVLGWAQSTGHGRLWATVWEWNTASRHVLAKLGFVEASRREPTPHGTTLVYRRQLDEAAPTAPPGVRQA